MLERLGHPERRVPPVIHVAGTNGKGSTIAFLRAMLEAAGKSVHVYTSPHLVRFNERFRLGAPGGGVLVSRRGACRCARRMRARQRRRADHRVRDRDRGGLRAVRAPSRRHAAARGRPRRAARRHQRDRAPARERRHAGLDGSHRISRRHDREDRRREGRHLPRRRAGRDRAADGRASRRVLERHAEQGARAAACRRPALDTRASSTAASSIRTSRACSICRRRSCSAATSSTMPAPRSRRCARPASGCPRRRSSRG